MVDTHVHLDYFHHAQKSVEDNSRKNEKLISRLHSYLYCGVTSIYDAGNDPERLPSEKTRGCLSLHPAREFQHHDPRGSSRLWEGVHLAGRIQYCGAHRIGHGTRLIDDIAVADGETVKLGDLAQYVLDKRIPLEICLLSNVHTGATPSLERHPFRILYQEKFRVTLNTDNRLMSNTSMTQEFEAAAETFGLTLTTSRKSPSTR